LRSVWVEGDKAEKSIVRAFQWFNKNQTDIDVLVLMRGGGGFENLKVFHSEEIAGEIVSSRIPVITGIGHEKDESIADYAADLWLSTPTAVAAYLTQQREELIRSVDAIWEDVSEKIVQLFEAKNIAIQTDAAALRIATERVFERSRYTLTSTVEKLYYLYEREFQNAKSRVEKAWVALTSLNPENVLQRGYSVVFNEQGLVLKNARDTSIGDKVFVRLHKGKLGTRVEEKK
jgi:exodeoxyribonuclease VII large subunit